MAQMQLCMDKSGSESSPGLARTGRFKPFF